MYTETTIVVREICNGVMAISGLTMIGVFTIYIGRRFFAYKYWYRDTAVQAAGAIVVLTLGHVTRAVFSWMEFFWFESGVIPWWANAIEIFLISTVLIVIGKMLIVYIFAPHRWRWLIVLCAGTVAVTIPLILAFAF